MGLGEPQCGELSSEKEGVCEDVPGATRKWYLDSSRRKDFGRDSGSLGDFCVFLGESRG